MRPRVGFLGVGWIGRDRLRALAESGLVDIGAVADVDGAVAQEVAEQYGAAEVRPDDLLRDRSLDGVVIATPSALHAEQTIVALEHGLAVFCQKPLGRSAAEVAAVVQVARRAGRLLGVDLSYRHLAATLAMREVVERGDIGEVYAADLVFHNAYGPDKAWFLDRDQSGGGCVIDLATHLVDLVAWMLPAERFTVASSRLYANGRLLPDDPDEVEDFATAQIDMSSGGSVSVACSWFLHAGCDAVISATFQGTGGAVSMHNVGGSFFDIEAAVHHGTTRTVIASPPDAWGGRAAVAWGRALAGGAAASEHDLDDLVATAILVDGIYGR